MSNFMKTEAGREVVLGMQALKPPGSARRHCPVWWPSWPSDDARWITGDIVYVDGWYQALMPSSEGYGHDTQCF